MDFFFPSFPTTLDCMVVILTMEYGSTRPYHPIIGVMPYPSMASIGIQFPVPGYLNTSTKYSAQMPCWFDNLTSLICSSVYSLRHTVDALCLMPWLCFCSSVLHSSIDWMKKKPRLVPWKWDSRYPM